MSDSQTGQHPMEDVAVKRQIGWLSFALCVTGVLAGFSIGMLGSVLRMNTTAAGYFVFAAMQLMAIVGGIAARSEVIGKIGATLAAILLGGSMLLVA